MNCKWMNFTNQMHTTGGIAFTNTLSHLSDPPQWIDCKRLSYVECTEVLSIKP